MAVKLRLQRHGRKGKPFYHIVAADARSRRDGRFIERIGYYNPTQSPALVEVDRNKAIKWLHDGAQPTDTVRSILSLTGTLYKKHLLRGIRKGAVVPESANKKLKIWLEAKSQEPNLSMVMRDWRVDEPVVKPVHVKAEAALDDASDDE